MRSLRTGAAVSALLATLVVAVGTGGTVFATGRALVVAPAPAFALHPQNPRYFLFRGRPTVLISSSEHYGAVVNLDFDYRPYLDALASRGLNLTRVFTGSYVEARDFIPGHGYDNTLAPRPGRFLAPWARSTTAGYTNGGNKFDLARWDAVYFDRLKSFLRDAGRRGIVVELVLFSAYYTEANWRLSPLHGANNVNGVGDVPLGRVYRLDRGNDGVLAAQTALARKLVQELESFDNLYYEILNEPDEVPCERTTPCATDDWQRHLASVLTEEHERIGRRHLIAQNVGKGAHRIEERDPRISIFNFHYADPEAVHLNVTLRRPIAHDETGFEGAGATPYRIQAWSFMLAGGAVFNNLDWSFAPGHERGTLPARRMTVGGGGPAIRAQLGVLRRFLGRFRLPRLRPAPAVVAGVQPASARVEALADPGRAYGVYVHGAARARLTLRLPAGRYRVEWVSTTTGKVVKRGAVIHAGGRCVTLDSPSFDVDIGLAIERAEAPH